MTTLPKKDEAIVADWKVEVRDWWYSIQDRLAEKDICLHERKRVEIENIIKNVLTAKNAEIEEAMREAVEAERERVNNKDYQLVEKLKEVRDELGLTQAGFGKKFGYTAMAISHFEKRNRKIPYKIKKYLQLPTKE